uniref:Uncharacterized protein n=1 Tax=viral metagenome TaxID=1070528 RepID=A0A6C0DBG7_9ZZZZ
MYFCPKCNYSFDISKSFGSDSTENKVALKKPNEAMKLFESNDSFNNFKAEFKFEELECNSKFKKLNETEKEKFNKLFQVNNILGAEFKCYNCNYTKEINESVLLYQYDLTEKNSKIKNIEDNKLLSNNPILPRTHDYICKNSSCKTNTSKAKKEAVFFRDKYTYNINYICCVCYYNW